MSAYAAVRKLAALLAFADAPAEVSLNTLLSQTESLRHDIDIETHHSTLPVVIAQVRQGRFIVCEALGKVMADPYLSRSERRVDIPLPRLSVIK